MIHCITLSGRRYEALCVFLCHLRPVRVPVPAVCADGERLGVSVEGGLLLGRPRPAGQLAPCADGGWAAGPLWQW